MSDSILICDTTALIILEKIGNLSLLKELFKEVYVTDEVIAEFGSELPDWIKVQNPVDNIRVAILETQLDLGEASAISLALELQNPLLLIDERKARRIAKQLNLKIIGTLGVLLLAKKENKILNLKPIIREMRKFGFRLSDKLDKEILLLANEL